MRKIATALISALIAAVLAAGSWALLFAKFTEIPATVARPADWASLSVDAQNQWLFEHSVTITGFPALLHIVGDIEVYAAPVLGFLGLLIVCALAAQGINALLRRRAP
jgi:hypothetical protein